MYGVSNPHDELLCFSTRPRTSPNDLTDIISPPPNDLEKLKAALKNKEADYVVKVRFPLFEIVSRSLSQHFSFILITHWGEITDPQVKQDNMNLRMDLCLIVSSLAKPRNTVNIVTGEFAPCVFYSKHYKDKLSFKVPARYNIQELPRSYICHIGLLYNKGRYPLRRDYLMCRISFYEPFISQFTSQS